MLKEFLKKIPKLPLSALIFYSCIIILWKTNLIPSPANILIILENLYNSYGLTGLFIASFLEGIVYLGLYFPGSFIVALAVIFSDGTFLSLISISITVAIALTITSLINYFFGTRIKNNIVAEKEIKKKIISKGLFVSMLHPNILAFYFFNSGIKRKNFLKIILVPLIMIPYGLAMGFLIYSVKEPAKIIVENPLTMITVILIWIIFAFIISKK
ncbi:MAG: hypothetical protein Q8N88_01075 [Nanoarchaeota archaeon]|nr:hypothetical protein [Nanoarchaeota archaeon]